MEYMGQTYYLVYDQVGSLRAVVNSTGLIVKRIDYDSFGNVILDTDPSFRIPIGFAGGLYDSDTGLVRFGVRDYDPAIGRWTAKDPIDFAGGSVNLYEYVQSSPINLFDPLGLFEVYPSLGDTWFNYGKYGANWSEFRKERQINKETWKAIGIMTGAVIITGTAATLGPEVYLLMMAHPEWMNRIAEFIASYFPGPPYPSWAGYSGTFTSYVIGEIKKRHEKVKEECR